MKEKGCQLSLCASSLIGVGLLSVFDDSQIYWNEHNKAEISAPELCVVWIWSGTGSGKCFFFNFIAFYCLLYKAKAVLRWYPILWCSPVGTSKARLELPMPCRCPLSCCTLHINRSLINISLITINFMNVDSQHFLRL